MKKSDIGLIGLGVMGKNLVLNMEDKGFVVSVYNRTASKVDDFLSELPPGKNITGAHSLEEFVASLSTPRKVLLMVKAGAPVDSFIKVLFPILEKGDIIMDGGNSHFRDTARRTGECGQRGLLYVGVGISGGEEGALRGPSIMPGGSPEAWGYVKNIFQAVAAKVGEATPCCDWIGQDGAGHFVKMVHNAIEYADMQLICESYWIMKNALGMETSELHNVFSRWNEGELSSYLIEITSEIFLKNDGDSGKPMIDIILDAAGQKGTGRWAAETALELGAAVPTIVEAVFARCISALKDERVSASKVLGDGGGPAPKYEGDRTALVNAIGDALLFSKICAYAQGFSLMKRASAEYNWALDFGQISLLWRGGCIIRARFLEKIKDAFDKNPGLQNLLLDPYFSGILSSTQENFRLVVTASQGLGIPVPALSSALAYFDSYRAKNLPANLLQAQRDYFGAHTYERSDRPRGEFFHTEWKEER